MQEALQENWSRVEGTGERMRGEKGEILGNDIKQIILLYCVHL